MVVSRDRVGGEASCHPQTVVWLTAVIPHPQTHIPAQHRFYFHSGPSHLLGRKRHTSWKQTLSPKGFAWKNYFFLNDLKEISLHIPEMPKKVNKIPPNEVAFQVIRTIALISPANSFPVPTLQSCPCLPAHQAWHPPAPLPGLVLSLFLKCISSCLFNPVAWSFPALLSIILYSMTCCIFFIGLYFWSYEFC